MNGDYDPHELKIIRRGVSIKKVIAAYKHFGSLREAGRRCGISADTVAEVLRRNNVSQLNAALPKKLSYYPRRGYSKFAKWVQAHKDDANLPYSVKAIASLADVSYETARCFFRRRRACARKILESLPDLRDFHASLEDIEERQFFTDELASYHYAIERYAQRAVLQGKIATGEVTVLIPSIEQFAARVKKLT